MWVLPDTAGVEPGYEQRDLNDDLARGGLVAVASGAGHPGAIRIHQRDAVLFAARLSSGESVEVPGGGHVHLFVALGAGALDVAGDLGQGDAVRLTDTGPSRFTASNDGTEVLVWVTA